MPGERGRGHEVAPEIARQRLEARGQVDRRADRGEVQAPGAADVAVQDVAQMQRQAIAQPGLAGFGPLGVGLRESGPGVARGGKRGAAGGRRIVGDREDAEQAVAHELQHLAAVRHRSRAPGSRNSR